MASIRSRNGKLLIDFRFNDVRCREQTALSDTKLNRAKLLVLAKQIDSAIRLCQFHYSDHFPGSKRCKEFEHLDRPVSPELATSVANHQLVSDVPLFVAFAAEWLGENEITWKVSHFKNMNLIFNNYLLVEFGEMRLEEITRPMLLKFRAELGKPKRKTGTKKVGNDWINHVMTPLRRILTEASLRYEFANPFTDIKPLKIEKPTINPFSLSEIRIFLAGVRPDFRNYYTTRFFTGLRTAEIDGLKWRFVNLERAEIQVQETLVDGYQETPKTRSSYRVIKVSKRVIDALRTQQDVTGKQEFVFCNNSGKPLDHRNINKRVWQPTLKLLNLPKRRPYETRHTAATLWLAAGENPEWIARQLGHSNTKMLFETYSQYVPNLTRQDGSAFEALLDKF
jgi:integrase